MKKINLLTLLVVISSYSSSLCQQSNLEKKIGSSTVELLRKTNGFYKNDKLQKEVETVGRSLESQLHLSEPLTYFLLDTSDPNAFATSGGYVFVTRGLLAVINSRDELAGIMAHELSHVTLGHSVKKLKASILPAVLELPANIVGLLTYQEIGNIINLPISITSKIAIASYSRTQEKQADLAGIELALKAGYNGYGLITALDRLTQYIEFTSGKQMPDNIFIDHPVTSKRLSYLTDILNKKGLAKPDYVPCTNIAALDGMIYGQNPEEGMMYGSKFVQRSLNLYCEFPEKWSIQNSPVSVAAVSPDNKSTIVLSLDSSAQAPSDAAKKSLTLLNKTSILHQEETIINGMPAYRATIRNHRIKYADHVTEIMWLKLPSNMLLKVVGISKFRNPDKAILASFERFRPLEITDLTGIPVMKIVLLEKVEGAEISAYVGMNNIGGQEEKLIGILNGISPGEKVHGARYIKTISVTPFSELK